MPSLSQEWRAVKVRNPEDEEKLTALKKAYAEIILNTAKEAAARIMVSERKALHYQQELFAAKDEALHMLLRLKQMLDAKVIEAEMMSMNQQKRIEELEAQLGEAEDIVRDLRAELREAQDELEKLAKDPMQCLGEQKSKDDVSTSVEISQDTINNFESVRSLPEAQSNFVTVTDIMSSVPSGTNVGNKCSCKDNCYVCNPDFASIVMRRKEPDLYRNGCTERIRALERCLLNGNLSLSGNVDDAKNENTRDDEKGNDMCTRLSLRADMCRVEGKTDEVKVMQSDVNDIIQALPLNSFHRKRKRAARYKKNQAPSSVNILSQVLATCQSSNLLCPESFLPGANENALLGEDSRIINNDTQKGPHSPTPSSLSAEAEVIIKSGYEEVDKDDMGFGKDYNSLNDKNSDKLLADEKELTREHSGSSEILQVPCKMDLEMVDACPVNPDSKESEITEGSSTQLVNNKFLMYTFKRKRKKDSLSSPERDCLLDDGTLQRKTEEKQNGCLDSEKPTLTIESSRGSRQLAQVARQLISLSEKNGSS